LRRTDPDIPASIAVFFVGQKLLFFEFGNIAGVIRRRDGEFKVKNFFQIAQSDVEKMFGCVTASL